MTTNMNFGPEWMRGALPKHNSIDNFASSDVLDPSTPYEENNNQRFLHSQQQQENNTFRYSKEFMLSLYKSNSQLSSDFKQHEYVTVNECLSPLAFEELSEAEKKLLSGPVHSEGPRNKNGGSRHQSPATENGPTTPVGSRFPARKGRTDYFHKEQFSKRADSDLLRRREQGNDLSSSLKKLDDEEKEPGWSGSNNPGLTALSSGLYGNTNDPFKSTEALFGSTADLSSFSSTPVSKKPEDVDWYYRDPTNQVQGPFGAHKMQDWYKSGCFEYTLMLRREGETVFEPLSTLIQKVGSSSQPFLMPRPSSSGVDLFGSGAAAVAPEPASAGGGASNLFRNSNGGPDFQSKYMPGNGVPTTPGRSIFDNFLSGNGSVPASPLYQGSFGGYGGSFLGNHRWNPADQPQTSPWLNPPNQSEFFGAPSNPLSPSLFTNQLFDYQRTMNEHVGQQQQYAMLQQRQQQQSMQYQQQFNQMQLPNQQDHQQPFQQQQSYQQQQPFQQQSPFQQQPPLQQQTQLSQQAQQNQAQPQQEAFKNSAFENITNNTNIIGSNHASPVMRSNILTGGWGSVPGTPVGTDAPSSPWGSIVPAAISSKVNEELQSKAPGTQSPRAPLSPTKKPIEKPAKVTPTATPSTTTATAITKNLVESFADIQLAEEKKAKATAEAAAAAAAAARAKAEQEAKLRAEAKSEAEAKAEAEAATTTVTNQIPPTPTKPIVSLREIQEEELRKANEKKQKQKQQIVAPTATWAASNPAPIVSTTSSTWTAPAAQKPLSLREIQEMEARNAELNKKEAPVPDYLINQPTTPTTLSWGVVVPTKSSNVASSTSNNSNANSLGSASTPWTAPTGPKKTLREIQQEEELAMKKKTAKASKAPSVSAASIASQASSASRAYPALSTPSVGSGWTTVTNIRQVKPVATPTLAPAAPAPIQPTVIKPFINRAAPPKPSGPSEDFRRWCRKALRDLNSGVNAEEIVSMLLSFPPDSNSAEIIEDIVYANSTRIDCKLFSQEFIKRGKADIAGRLDIVNAGMKEEEEGDFKVVVTKKSKRKL